MEEKMWTAEKRGMSDVEKKTEEIISRGERRKRWFCICRGLNVVTGHLQIMKKSYFRSSLCTKYITTLSHWVFAKRSTGIPLKKNCPRIKCIRKTPRAKMRISEFLSRDDNSRVKAGIKATITRKGEKRQIRLLNYDLKTFHAKFLSEASLKVSYSLFANWNHFTY